MNPATQTPDVALIEEPASLQFVVDADLVYIGGGTGVMDY